MSLIEVLIGTALSVMLILLVYQTSEELSRTTSQTSSKTIALSKVMMIENQLRSYISHAGLGVAQDQPVIILAKQDYLTLEANSGWYSYAVEDTFLPANSVTNVKVHDATGIKHALEDANGSIELTILSDDKVPLVGDDEIAPTVEVDPETIDESAGMIKVTTGDDSFFIRRGQYIGQPAQLHEFTLQDGELHLKITSVEGNEKELVLASGIEAFDASFYYKPGDSEVEEPPVWTVDDADADPDCKYKRGTFEQPGTFCDPSDPDYDNPAVCISCAGTINRGLDTDRSGQIDEDDDQDQDDVMDGFDLHEAGKLSDASLLRIWLLVAGDRMFGSKGDTSYVVGRKILRFSDGRQRSVAVVDLDIKNL